MIFILFLYVLDSLVMLMCVSVAYAMNLSALPLCHCRYSIILGNLNLFKLDYQTFLAMYK